MNERFKNFDDWHKFWLSNSEGRNSIKIGNNLVLEKTKRRYYISHYNHEIVRYSRNSISINLQIRSATTIKNIRSLIPTRLTIKQGRFFIGENKELEIDPTLGMQSILIKETQYPMVFNLDRINCKYCESVFRCNCNKAVKVKDFEIHNDQQINRNDNIDLSGERNGENVFIEASQFKNQTTKR